MNYWLTTQYPLFLDESHHGIWLKNGNQEAGKDIRKNDLVFIYESKTGKTEVEYINGKRKPKKRLSGEEGIIALHKIIDEKLLKNKETKETEYWDGSTALWCWSVETKKTNKDGFVPRKNINKILEYKPKYNFHGFGKAHSGLLKLTEQQFEKLKEVFQK